MHTDSKKMKKKKLNMNKILDNQRNKQISSKDLKTNSFQILLKMRLGIIKMTKKTRKFPFPLYIPEKIHSGTRQLKNRENGLYRAMIIENSNKSLKNNKLKEI